MKMPGIFLVILLTAVSAVAFGADGVTKVALDPTFGRGGIVTTAAGKERSGASAVKIQLDGKIVAVGFSIDYGHTERFSIARFNDDGSLDQGFGTRGITITVVGVNGSASAVAIQTDGKIVVSGYSVVDATTSGFTLARYNHDGKLDPTFGKAGIVTPPTGAALGRASAIAIQADGKIVVGGGINIRGFEDFSLARYNTDGTLDLTFGKGGFVTTAINKASDRVAAVAIQLDGKIVAVGSGKENVANHFALARYHPNGTLDPTFGKGGIVIRAIGKGDSFASAMIMQPDGKIVAVGSSSTAPNGNSKYTPAFTLARFNSDGTIDPHFGAEGIVTTAIGKGASSASAAAIQSDGKIVVAGMSVKTVVELRYYHNFAVARYNSDGTLDATFGTGGSEITEIGAGTDIANAVAIQADGKIIAAGYSRIGTQSEFSLIRYFP